MAYRKTFESTDMDDAVAKAQAFKESLDYMTQPSIYSPVKFQNDDGTTVYRVTVTYYGLD